MTEQQKLVWYSPEDDVKMCVVKGKDEVNFNLIDIDCIAIILKQTLCDEIYRKPVKITFEYL